MNYGVATADGGMLKHEEALMTTPSDADNEAAWVIVRDLPGQLGYFDGMEFVSDNAQAIRFARRADAVRMLTLLHGGSDHADRVEEHQWIEDACAPTDAQRDSDAAKNLHLRCGCVSEDEHIDDILSAIAQARAEGEELVHAFHRVTDPLLDERDALLLRAVTAEQEVAKLAAALRECTDAAGITYAGWPTDVTEAVAHVMACKYASLPPEVFPKIKCGCVDARAVLERHGLLAPPASNETPT